MTMLKADAAVLQLHHKGHMKSLGQPIAQALHDGCRYAGLECHLILRNTRQAADSDPGLVGNLLIDRMTGAHIHQV
jgi:hypothetical protein